MEIKKKKDSGKSDGMKETEHKGRKEECRVEAECNKGKRELD